MLCDRLGGHVGLLRRLWWARKSEELVGLGEHEAI